MIQIDKKQLITIITGFIIFIALVIIVSIVFIINQNSNQIIIGNYDKYTKSLPQDRRLAINTQLYNILKSSSPDKDININDAVIRKGSYTETYNESEKTYSSTFIIDIPSIKQSYIVIFIWSKDAKTILKGDNLKFGCLTKDQLIYGDFNCSKILKIPIISTDPILQYVPYTDDSSGITYKIDAHMNNGALEYLSIFFNACSTDVIEIFKTEALNWIKSKSINPDNYIIKYSSLCD